MPTTENTSRGFINVKCPVNRCEYKYRFKETDQTLADEDTLDRRHRWLRVAHAAGHPASKAE